MPSRLTGLRVGAVAALSGWLVLGCSDLESNATTGVVVVVRSDLRPGDELDRILLETVRHDGERRLATFAVKGDYGEHEPTLPASFVVYAEDPDVQRGVRLHIAGFGPDDLSPRVRRSVHLHFLPGRVLRLVIDLARICEDRFQFCETSGQTCDGDGRCVDLEIDPNDLEPVVPGEEQTALPLFPRPSADLDNAQSSNGFDAGDGATAADEVDGGAEARSAESLDASMLTDARQRSSPKDHDAGEAPHTMPDDEDAAIDPSCSEGAIRCLDDELLTCRDGVYVRLRACEHGCYDGADTCAECIIDDQVCRANTLEICDEHGQWAAVVGLCRFGCEMLSTQCREDTPLGQALIHVIVN